MVKLKRELLWDALHVLILSFAIAGILVGNVFTDQTLLAAMGLGAIGGIWIWSSHQVQRLKKQFEVTPENLARLWKIMVLCGMSLLIGGSLTVFLGSARGELFSSSATSLAFQVVGAGACLFGVNRLHLARKLGRWKPGAEVLPSGAKPSRVLIAP